MILKIFQNFRKLSKKTKIFELKIGVRTQHETSILLTMFNENLSKRNFNTILITYLNLIYKQSQTNDTNIEKKT